MFTNERVADKRKKAKRAKIRTQDRRVCSCKGARRRQQRTVTSKHDDQLRAAIRHALAHHAFAIHVGSTGLVQIHFVTMLLKPRHKLRQQGRQLRLERLRDDGNMRHTNSVASMRERRRSQ